MKLDMYVQYNGKMSMRVSLMPFNNLLLRYHIIVVYENVRTLYQRYAIFKRLLKQIIF